MSVVNIVNALIEKLAEKGIAIDTAKADMTVKYAKVENGTLYVNTNTVKAELAEPASFEDYVVTKFYIKTDVVEDTTGSKNNMNDFMHIHNQHIEMHNQHVEIHNQHVVIAVQMFHHGA